MRKRVKKKKEKKEANRITIHTTTMTKCAKVIIRFIPKNTIKRKKKKRKKRKEKKEKGKRQFL